MATRRRRRNPDRVHDAVQLAELALVGIGIYIAWQLFQGVKNTGASAVNALQNFDQNTGLNSIDNAISSLFSSPTPPAQ